MKTLAFTIAAAALAAGAPALAQQAWNGPTVAPGNAVLTVTGQADSTASPDLALFSAGVQTQARTAGEALAENSRKMAAVIASLKKSGIAERDIQTSNLSVSPVYSDPERDAMLAARTTGQPYIPPSGEQLRRIIGYNVSNTVSVRQRDLKNFGSVIDTLVSAGANQVQGPDFQLEQQESALDGARTRAVKDARRRADLYASAAELRVVRVLTISEGGGYVQPRMMARYSDMAAPPAPPPPPIQPGELTLNASVNVTYELAP